MKKTIGLILVLLAFGLTMNFAEADVIFGIPSNLSPTINTSSDDAGPSMTADSLELYMDCNRAEGQDGYDI